jgi:hypothetical protein
MVADEVQTNEVIKSASAVHRVRSAAHILLQF